MKIHWVTAGTDGVDYYYRVEETGNGKHALCYNGSTWNYFPCHVPSGVRYNVLHGDYLKSIGGRKITEEDEVQRLNRIMMREMI